MWAAFDDLRDLTFACLYRKAGAISKAVLCHTYTELFIQNEKERFGVTNLDSLMVSQILLTLSETSSIFLL